MSGKEVNEMEEEHEVTYCPKCGAPEGYDYPDHDGMC